eukprot:gene30169-39366_t
MDGVQVYSNANEMSFFRNKGFWYLGNLEPWPPETHFRCVEPEGCNYNLPVPPTTAEGAWKPNKRFQGENLPVIQSEPCDAGSSPQSEEL